MTIKKKPILSSLFENLEVIEKGSKLIGNSKTLHHLLLDLIPPIDRKHTLNFFYKEKFIGGTLYTKIRQNPKKTRKKYFWKYLMDSIRFVKKVDHVETIYSERKRKFHYFYTKID